MRAASAHVCEVLTGRSTSFLSRTEVISECDVRQSFEVASEPKETRRYDTGHFLNDQARQDRIAWLGERLGLSPT
jgi:hypothetical protein